MENYGIQEVLTGKEKSNPNNSYLIVVPLERIPNRYTEEWRESLIHKYESTPKSQEKLLILSRTEARDKEQKNFNSTLDMLNCRYSQMIELLKVVEHLGRECKIRIFFMDVWSMGAEGIAYLRDLENYKNIKLEGFFHAGCWDSDDRLYASKCSDWGVFFELMMMRCLDTVYVGSDFSKKLLEEQYGECGNIEVVHPLEFPTISLPEMIKSAKSAITGSPDFISTLKELIPDEETPVIYFPHRMSDEKGVTEWELFKKIAKRRFAGRVVLIDNDFIIKNLNPNGLQKNEYHYLLLYVSSMVVSFAKQETYGICMVEAITAGIPVVIPDRASYRQVIVDGVGKSKGGYQFVLSSLSNIHKVNTRKLIQELEEVCDYLRKEGAVQSIKSHKASLFEGGSKADDVRFEWLLKK